MAKTNYLLRVVLALIAAVVAALAMMLASGSPSSWAQTNPTNTIKVNTIEDETNPNDGKCSLREAIQNANDNSQTSPDCQAGSATEGDRIIFSLSNKTIVVGSQLPDIAVDPSGLTIDGRGSKITISGDDSVRVFAVSAGAQLTLKNLTVAHGKDGIFGGGAYNASNGTLIVDHSTFSNNTSDFDGGGIFNATGATLEMTNSTVSDNSARQGGGVYNAGGMLTVTNSTFSGNSAVGFDSSSPGFGGGMINDGGGTAEVTNSTFSKNSTAQTSGLGGGIHNEATLNLTNSTLSGNNVGGNTGGSAGISNLGTLTVTSSTFSNNGIYNGNAATLSNTILANVSSGDNCSGTITDEGYNISDDGSCNFTDSTSKNDTDPLLDPNGLRNNGGPTKTIKLLNHSPAINAIPKGQSHCATTADPITTDQRGVKRPQGSGCDIGAFEKKT